MAIENLKSKAILELRPEGGFSVELTGEVIYLLEGYLEPTEAEIQTEMDRLQAEYDATQYQRDRQYPSIGDQLDMQYHDQLDGTTTWKDAIAKVKSDNPKE